MTAWQGSQDGASGVGVCNPLIFDLFRAFPGCFGKTRCSRRAVAQFSRGCTSPATAPAPRAGPLGAVIDAGGISQSPPMLGREGRRNPAGRTWERRFGRPPPASPPLGNGLAPVGSSSGVPVESGSLSAGSPTRRGWLAGSAGVARAVGFAGAGGGRVPRSPGPVFPGRAGPFRSVAGTRPGWLFGARA